MQINMQPMVIMYTSTLSYYRNTVNQRHPNDNNSNKTRRRIQTLVGCRGKRRGGRIGSVRSGKGGVGRGSRNPSARHNYEWQGTDIDGKIIKVHPLYQFEVDQ